MASAPQIPGAPPPPRPPCHNWSQPTLAERFVAGAQLLIEGALPQRLHQLRLWNIGFGRRLLVLGPGHRGGERHPSEYEDDWPPCRAGGAAAFRQPVSSVPTGVNQWHVNRDPATAIRVILTQLDITPQQ